MILKRIEKLGSNTHFVTGNAGNRRKIALQPIYEHLGPRRALALPGFHSITGSDTTGRIKGIGKKSSFKVFMESTDHIIDALASLGDGDFPCDQVISGCQKFVCMLTSTKEISASDAATLRWKKFKRLKYNNGM